MTQPPRACYLRTAGQTERIRWHSYDVLVGAVRSIRFAASVVAVGLGSWAMAGVTPFFITGCGRSGTTLLRLMLANHSRIHIPAETWFIRSLVAEFSLTA